MGFVPLATGIAFLIMGSKGQNSCPGHPVLPEFLLISGTFVAGLGLLTAIGQFIVNFGLPSDRDLTPQEEHIVWLLRHIGHFFSIAQVLVLIIGTIFIAPLASTIHPWNYIDPNDKYYCDYTTVVFMAVFFPSVWTLLIFALISFVCIKCSNVNRRSARNVKEDSGVFE